MYIYIYTYNIYIIHIYIYIYISIYGEQIIYFIFDKYNGDLDLF